MPKMQLAALMSKGFIFPWYSLAILMSFFSSCNEHFSYFDESPSPADEKNIVFIDNIFDNEINFLDFLKFMFLHNVFTFTPLQFTHCA